MIAREDGQVVLVSGAIPGERVDARVERVAQGRRVRADRSTWRRPSADRRSPSGRSALCGGVLYSHIAYPRQLEIKASDHRRRVRAHRPRRRSPRPCAVAPSPEEGYRMRARFHVRGRRLGFFREGTHDLCDIRADASAPAATCDALDRLDGGAALARRRAACRTRTVGERRRVRARRPSRNRSPASTARGLAPDGDRRLDGPAATRHRVPHADSIDGHASM